jgi:hypothetical protein
LEHHGTDFFLKVQDVGAEKDAITFLRAPTHYGKPNWDRLFPSIIEKHPETDVGVVSPDLILCIFVLVINFRSTVLLWTSGSFETDSSKVEQVL